MGGADNGAIGGVFRPGPWLSICVGRSEAKPDCIERPTIAERPGRRDKAQQW